MKSKEKARFIEVTLNLPLNKNLNYRIPEHLIPEVAIGKRVRVPLGKRKVKGYVVALEALVSVEDTGVGIAEERLETLFKPLNSTKPKGMGLGLPVCKKMVEVHGGRIEVESEVGKGTTFTVILPVRREEDEVPVEAQVRPESIANAG